MVDEDNEIDCIYTMVSNWIIYAHICECRSSKMYEMENHERNWGKMIWKQNYQIAYGLDNIDS